MTNRAPHSDGTDRLLTETEACRILRCSRSYLSRMRREFRRTGRDYGPTVLVLPGGTVRYRLSDLQEWIASCVFSPPQKAQK